MLCVCFYILGKTVISPSLKGVALCKNDSWGPVALFLWAPELGSQGTSLCGLGVISSISRATAVAWWDQVCLLALTGKEGVPKWCPPVLTQARPKENSKMMPVSASIPRESQQVTASPEVPPSLASQSPLHMVQAPFKLPLLCEVSGQVSQCMSPLRAVSPFSTALWT